MEQKRTTDIVQVPKKPFGHPFVLAMAVISGPDPHAIHRIVKEETLVGFAESCGFHLADNLVSGEHFVVRIHGAMYSMVDLDSTNGTFINDRKVAPGTPTRLKNWDEIRVGNTRLLFIANRYRDEQP